MNALLDTHVFLWWITDDNRRNVAGVLILKGTLPGDIFKKCLSSDRSQWVLAETAAASMGASFSLIRFTARHRFSGEGSLRRKGITLKSA
jgi:hypothetical protein